MSRRMEFTGVLGVLAILVLLLVSCGPRNVESLAERIIEKAAAQAGEEIDINLKDNEVSIKDDEGHTLTVGGAELPETWPESVPFDKKLEIGMVNSYQKGGKDNWNITASYPGPVTDIYDSYKSALSDWAITVDTLLEPVGGNLYTLKATDDSFEMRLIIADKEDFVTVAILLARL